MIELTALQQLETLDLDGTAVTDKGLLDLIALEKLTSVGARATRITDDGVFEFGKATRNRVSVDNFRERKK